MGGNVFEDRANEEDSYGKKKNEKRERKQKEKKNETTPVLS